MRVKGGAASRRRHKRLLKRTKGFYGRKGNCFKLAKRAIQKAGQYAYRDRKKKKREFRSLWIIRINAAVRTHGMSYSKFIQGLRGANIDLDRKALAELAMHQPVAFASIVEKARSATAL